MTGVTATITNAFQVLTEVLSAVVFDISIKILCTLFGQQNAASWLCGQIHNAIKTPYTAGCWNASNEPKRHSPMLHSLSPFVIPPDYVSTRHISMRVNLVDTPEHRYCFSLSACTSEQGDSEDGSRCLQPPCSASFTDFTEKTAQH